jgi:hypothetical protein
LDGNRRVFIPNTRTLIYTGLIGAASFVAATSAASAAVICNEDGDCWRTGTSYTYPPHARVTIHDDNWKWGEGQRYRWREHEGRGFWRGDAWEEF